MIFVRASPSTPSKNNIPYSAFLNQKIRFGRKDPSGKITLCTFNLTELTTK